MITRFAAHGLTWIDLESPTSEETTHIAEEFGIPHLVSEELIDHTLRSKVDLYPDFLYLVLRFPHVHEHSTENDEQEIDFIVGNKFMITVRYDKSDAVTSFAKLFEAHTLTNHVGMTPHGTFLFMQLTKLLYSSSLHQLEHLTVALKEIERRIFTKNQVSIVRDISHMSRTLLDFKQSVRFHAEVLASYESASKRLFGDEYAYYAEVASGEYKKISSILESHREMLAELQRTNDTLLSTKSNEIMRNFTIMTFVMLPLTLITGIFGMNTVPELIFIKSLPDFYFVIGVMGITGAVLFLFFKIRRWL